MPHSLGQVYVHLVLSTASRAPVLNNQVLRGDLYGYMTGIFRNLGSPSLRIGGVEDHLHALFRLSRMQPIVHVVQEVQRGSLNWLHNRGGKDIYWQGDYGTFSVSPQNVNSVIRYIKNQEVHHRKESFADEYHRILQKSGGHEHKVNVHLIFSTKNRFPFLADKTIRQLLHNRLAEICEAAGCPCLRVGGVEDHVHLLYQLSQEQSLARTAQEVKKNSSRWLATQHNMPDFDWQDGYGAFSVSPQHTVAVIRYIENQEEHHRHETFTDETSRGAGGVQIRKTKDRGKARRTPGTPGTPGREPSPMHAFSNGRRPASPLVVRQAAQRPLIMLHNRPGSKPLSA